MGCGASSAASAAAPVAGGAGAGADVAIQQVASMTKREGIFGDIDVDAVLKNLEAAGEDARGVLEDLMGCSEEGLSEAGELVGNILEASKEVLEIVLHVAIPPPGGAVIIACITAAVCFIKSGINVKELEELTMYAFRILKAILEKRNVLKGAGSSLTEAFKEYFDTANKIKDYMEEVKGSSKIWQMCTWGTTKIKIEDLTQELERIITVLSISAQMEGLEVLSDMREAAKMKESKLAEMGGAEAIVNDKAKLERFKKACSASEQVMIQMQTQVLDVVDSGPHKLLPQESLRSLWRSYFQKEEHVQWKQFWRFFPEHMPATPDQIKLALIDELSTDAAKLKFQAAVEDMEDESSVSVHELRKAFPEEVDILDKVRLYKKQEIIDKCYNGIPKVPGHFTGRDEIIEHIISKLEGDVRVIQLQGAPGEGKLTVACATAQKMYNERKLMAGAYFASLEKVTTEEQIMERLMQGLSTSAAKSSEKDAGVKGQLDARLADIKRKGELGDALLVVDNCEDVALIQNDEDDDSETLEQIYEKVLLRLVQAAPKLKVLMCTRTKVQCDSGLFKAGITMETVMLPVLNSRNAGLLLRSIVGGSLREDDAIVIATNFGQNPQLIELVGRLLKCDDISVEDAKEMSLEEACSDADESLSRELKKMRKPIEKAITTLPEDKQAQMMKLSFMLGPFDVKMVQVLLEMKQGAVKTLLKTLTARSLVQKVHDDDAYMITATVRDILRAIMNNPKKRAKFGMDEESMDELKARLIKACRAQLQDLFALYMTAPGTTFPIIMRAKTIAQQALNFAHSDAELAKDHLDDLLYMLRLLPYLSTAFDRPIVHKACDAVAKLCTKAGNDVGVAQCKAVKALFFNVSNINQSATLAQEARALLEGKTGDEAMRALAMACRAEGWAVRESAFDTDASLAAMKVGKEALDKQSSPGEEDKAERIILLAEMAGTYDYAGNFVDGEPVGLESVAAAKAFFGEASKHPIFALCITNLAFFTKAKGEAAKASDPEEAKAFHRQAVEQHSTARAMRQQVLGRTHMDTAISIQQMAISLQALGQLGEEGKMAEADQAFTESLEIRVNSLGENHILVANTLVQMCKLYLAMEHLPDAEKSAQKALDIRVTLGLGAKKKQEAARLLVQAMESQGKDADAAEIKKAYEV